MTVDKQKDKDDLLENIDNHLKKFKEIIDDPNCSEESKEINKEFISEYETLKESLLRKNTNNEQKN